MTREGTRTRQEINALAAPRLAQDAEDAFDDSYSPHRIKGANLTGSVLQPALATSLF